MSTSHLLGHGHWPPPQLRTSVSTNLMRIPSAAALRAGSSPTPPPRLRPPLAMACRYPMVFERLVGDSLHQPQLRAEPRPDTAAERWQSLQSRPVTAPAPEHWQQQQQPRPVTSVKQRRQSKVKAVGGSPGSGGALPSRLSSPAQARAPSRPELSRRPQAAWDGVTGTMPPPADQQPWRTMLLGAHWSNYMGEKQESGDAWAVALAEEEHGCTGGARESGRQMLEAGFGRGRLRPGPA